MLTTWLHSGYRVTDYLVTGLSFDSSLISRNPMRSVAVWLVGCWLLGWLVADWLAAWLLVGWLLGCWLAGCLVAGWLAAWLPGFGWLRVAGWLVRVHV